jgi:predicted AAA+ superfamily ATPase
MITRTLSQKLAALQQKFQVISLTGPRQSGKTTLVRAAFPHMAYVSLEDPDIRQIALTDPRGFLSNYPAGAILDEVQNTPDLFSYIQTLVDTRRDLQFILTGSSNFLLLEKISQTLAGRTALLHLLPFSLKELEPLPESYEEMFSKGSIRVFMTDLAQLIFTRPNIQTYIDRDVRHD